MKRLEIIALVVLVYVVASCGVSQKAQNQLLQQQLMELQYQQQRQQLQNQQLQQQLQNQQQQQSQNQQLQQSQNQQLNAADILYQQQLKMANENPHMYLATQAGPSEIRGYGEAYGFDSVAAYDFALQAAEDDVASFMYNFISACENTTITNAQKDRRHTTERLNQRDIQTLAEGSIVGLKVLSHDVEETPNGFRCRMCVTMDANTATEAVLDQLEMQGVIENAEKFRAQAAKIREDLRNKQKGWNAATDKTGQGDVPAEPAV